MTFWELVFEHPGWVTIWLFVVWLILPSFSFTWSRSSKKPDKP